MSLFRLTKEAEELGYLDSIYKLNKENKKEEDISYTKVVSTAMDPLKQSASDIAMGAGIGAGLGTLVGTKVRAIGPGHGAYIGATIGALPGIAKKDYLYMKKISDDVREDIRHEEEEKLKKHN